MSEWVYVQETKSVDYIERKIKDQFGGWPDDMTRGWLKRRFRWANAEVLDRVHGRYLADREAG